MVPRAGGYCYSTVTGMILYYSIIVVAQHCYRHACSGDFGEFGLKAEVDNRVRVMPMHAPYPPPMYG